MDKNPLVRLIGYFSKTADAVIVVCVFAIVNASAFLGGQFPDVALFDGEGWWAARAGGVVAVLALVNLFARKELGAFGRLWFGNRPLVVFLLYSLTSLLWTVYLPASLYELSFLFFSSFAAAYFAARYRLRGSINLLTGIAAFCVLISLYIVFFTHGGVMQNRPFIGSWNGMFWHRNHSGSLMAFFNMIFLTRLLMDTQASAAGRLAYGAFYLLSLWHVFGSRSAAGILIFVFLNLAAGLFYCWSRWRHKLAVRHYYAFGAAAIAGFLVFVTNLGFFFGLLGRSASMTGRTPLWNDLLFNFYAQKPIFGHGFGALWMQESFRLLMQSRHGWPYPVYFADNGFLDILLNLGVAGLLLFLFVFIAALARSVRKIRETGSWEYIFLFLTLAYVALGNIAYSFLMEVDYFVWMTLVLVAFLLLPEHAPNLAEKQG